MTDEDDRGLARRLRAYESRVPDAPAPSTTLARRLPWMPVLAAGAAVVAVVAGAWMSGMLDRQPDVGETDASPTPSIDAGPTGEPNPSLIAEPSTSTPVASATPEPTLGPIVRWATAASFGSDGNAEEVLDISYGGGHFIAVGFREPLNARGQVGPSQREALIWISTDGAAWEELPLGPEFEGAEVLATAALPDGAAAIYGFVDSNPDPSDEEIGAAAWSSTDGRTWTRYELALPARPDSPIAPFISSVTDGAKGYLTLDTYATDDGLVTELWYSSDGARWEVVNRFATDSSGWTISVRDVGAGDEGFVLVGERYEVDAEQREYEPIVQASADGRTWIDANPNAMPAGPNLLVAAVHGDWIVTQTDFETSTDITWFSHDGLTWEQRQGLEVPVPADAEDLGEGTVAVIGRIVEAGDRAFISGALVYCCHGPWFAAGVWSSFDASSWEKLGFPDDAVIAAAAVHDGVTVLAGHTGATPTDDWKANATFWVSERR